MLDRDGPAPKMFPEDSRAAGKVSPLNLGKLGEGKKKKKAKEPEPEPEEEEDYDPEYGGNVDDYEDEEDDDPENSNSPRTRKWRKENATRSLRHSHLACSQHA